MPPRLQRFFLRLLKYDYSLHFVPGEELLLADMLSRAPQKPPDIGSSQYDVEVHAVGVVTDMVSSKTLSRLVEATEKDPDLQSVIRFIREDCSLVGSMKPFAAEFSLVKGIVLKGTKVVIPKSMMGEMLQRIHEGHLGLN